MELGMRELLEKATGSINTIEVLKRILIETLVTHLWKSLDQGAYYLRS